MSSATSGRVDILQEVPGNDKGLVITRKIFDGTYNLFKVPTIKVRYSGA